MPSVQPTASNGYLIPHDFQLSRPNLQALFGSIHSRLEAREALEASFQALVAQGTNQSLALIQQTVAPQLAALVAQLNEADGQLDAALAQVTQILAGNLPAVQVTESPARRFVPASAGAQKRLLLGSASSLAFEVAINVAQNGEVTIPELRVPWARLTEVPHSFVPSAHSHTIQNIAGLESALNALAQQDGVLITSLASLNTALQSQAAAIAGLNPPTGTLREFPQGSVPTGWLACDGAAYLRTAYPALAAWLGALRPYQVSLRASVANISGMVGRVNNITFAQSNLAAGVFLTSADNTAFTSRNVGYGLPLTAVAFFNGLYVAYFGGAGEAGLGVSTSTDLATWTYRTTVGASAVAQSGTHLVSVGAQYLSVSTNGTTFSSAAIALGVLQAYRSVAFGAGVFVLTGATVDEASGGTAGATQRVYTSASPAASSGAWTARALPNAIPAGASLAVSFVNGRFVLRSSDRQVFESADGITWTRRSTNGPTDMNANMVFLDGDYVCGAFASRDLIEWVDMSNVSRWPYALGGVSIVAGADIFQCPATDIVSRVQQTPYDTAAQFVTPWIDPLLPRSSAALRLSGKRFVTVIKT